MDEERGGGQPVQVPALCVEGAVERIKGWNLHIFAMRRPRGLLLGSDVVFVEPPRA